MTYQDPYRSAYDDAPAIRITRAVQRLILLNIIVFVGQLIVDIPLGGILTQPYQLTSPGGRLIDYLAFHPVLFLHGLVWTPVTYIFLHSGLLHLFLNMLWLFFFGPEVERILSTRQFYRFFIFCGAAGVFATYVPALVRGDASPVIGASGAVMGVVVAFAMTNPERQFFLFPFPIPINARALVLIVIVMNVIAAFSGTNTSVATHFGGMGAGFLYMRYVPRIRAWWVSRSQKRPRRDPKDVVGEAVDNIFEFDEERKRRKH